jgi:hypothetical protein
MMYFRYPKPHLNVIPINTLIIEDPLEPSVRASEPAEVEFIDENGGGPGLFEASSLYFCWRFLCRTAIT